MRTRDWSSVVTPKVLLIGEHSTLQWSDDVMEYVMFLDYYFRSMPYDHGERSRYIEAKSIFECITDLTSGKYRPEQIYATNLCLEPLRRAPRGKKILIPEVKATLALKHINRILAENPSIEVVFVMSMQSNYLLQKLGFYEGFEAFLHGGQPRKVGLESEQPYYQPVDAKTFQAVCGNIYHATGSKCRVVPIHPAKDYPLIPPGYEAAYEEIKKFFK